MTKKKIIVGNEITIKGASEKLKQAIYTELEIDNPQFILLERLGKSTWNTPRTFSLYLNRGDDIVIPFGAVSNPKIRKHLIGYEFEVEPSVKNEVYLKLKMPLYDYQQKALNEMVKGHRGVLVGTTGSGKTNIGLAMIKKLGLRALWITHTTDLLYQSRDRAREIFENVDVGYITAGKIDIGNDITFATVQTLNRVIDVVADEFNVVIVDEAHHCVGSPTMVTMFYRSMQKLNAQYKYGLTATPKRADGLEKMVFALLGDVVHEIPQNEIKNKVLPIIHYEIENTKEYDIEDYTNSAGMIDAHKFQSMLYYDETRNDLVVEKAKRLIGESGGVLILCKYVKQAEYIHHKLLENDVDSELLVGRVARGKRQEILDNPDTEVIVATTSLAKEGLDIPRYQDLILAYSITNKGEFVQTVGRVRRADGIKTISRVWDIKDNSIPHVARRVRTHGFWARSLNK